MIRKAKKKKVENNFNKMLVDLLLQCTCWAQFNIYLIFKHTPLDSKMLIAIIHYAFENSNADFDKWFVDQTVLKQHESLRINAQQILIGACEDLKTVFTDDMIDVVLRKACFNSNSKIIDGEILKRIIVAIAKRNPMAVRTAYEKYTQFKKYQV